MCLPVRQAASQTTQIVSSRRLGWEAPRVCRQFIIRWLNPGGRQLGEEPGDQQRYDREDGSVTNDPNVSDLHVAHHHAGQPGKAKRPCQEHSGPDPAPKPVASKDWSCGNEREAKAKVPCQYVERVEDRGPLPAEQLGKSGNGGRTELAADG